MKRPFLADEDEKSDHSSEGEESDLCHQPLAPQHCSASDSEDSRDGVVVSWYAEFEWLEEVFVDGIKGMRCRFCYRAKKNNPFAAGTARNFRKSSPHDHQLSTCHTAVSI